MLLQVVPASVPLLRPNRHHPRFDLIVTDVDGTLLDSSHTLRDDVRRALLRARELGVPCCLATGKTRGAVAEAADAVAKGMPGVYSQGLDVRAADGFSIWTGVLEPALAAESARLGAALGLSVLAFCGADMLCTARNAQTDRLLAYGESCPITAAERGFKDLPEALAAGTTCQKLLLLGTDEMTRGARPAVAEALGARVDLVFAVKGMLEVLPPGQSKATGVLRLLEFLGVERERVLAFGDGENDAGMLELAGCGVAVGNAAPEARAVADVVLAETNDQGAIAVALERLL